VVRGLWFVVVFDGCFVSLRSGEYKKKTKKMERKEGNEEKRKKKNESQG